MRMTKRRRLGLIVATAAAVLGTAGTAAVTLSGFSASIVNPTNTFSSATVQLEEGNGVTNCFSTGTGTGGSVTSANQNTNCANDAFGAPLTQVPGGAATSSTVTVTNVGNVGASSGSLAAGSCAAAAAANDGGYVGSDTAGFCGLVDVTIYNSTTGNCVLPAGAGACPAPSSSNTLANIGTVTLPALAAGANNQYVLTTQLDSSATNADQGLTATVPLTWTINQ